MHDIIFNEESGVFSQSRGTKLDRWMQDARAGMEGGPTFVKLVCLAGLLKGISESQAKKPALNIRSLDNLENDMISIVGIMLQPADYSWGAELDQTGKAAFYLESSL
jgi:hypothetical protein